MLPKINIFTSMKNIKYALFDQSEVISDVIRERGEWNSHCIELADSVLERSDGGIVLDIGAGFGAFSVPLASLHKRYNFHCFEPLKVINSQLKTNILINGLDNVVSYECGIGQSNETVKAPILDVHHSMNHGSFSFDENINSLRGMVSSTETQEYEFKTIDSFNFDKVKLIKISTPGMELKVFKGMVETLHRNNFPPVIFETWELDWYKEENDRVFDFLASRPYEHYMMLGSHAMAFKTKSQCDYLLAKTDTKGELGSFKIAEQIHETGSVLENQAALR